MSKGCVPVNRGKVIRRGHMKWEEVLGVGGGGGVRRVAGSQAILTCYQAVCDETSADFSYSLDSDRSK